MSNEVIQRAKQRAIRIQKTVPLISADRWHKRFSLLGVQNVTLNATSAKLATLLKMKGMWKGLKHCDTAVDFGASSGFGEVKVARRGNPE
jgi:hypothetical protein